MQLLVVTPWPVSSPGGGQRLVQGMATALAADHGVELLVAAGSGLSSSVPAPQSPAPIREIRLPLVYRPRPSWRPFGRSPVPTAYLDGLDALAEDTRPEAILYTPHCSRCGYQAAALAARLKIPFFLWPAIHLDRRAHTNGSAQRYYRSAAMVLCLSDIERQWLVRHAGVSPQRAVTLGYGWRGEAARRPRRSSTSHELRLLTVGAYVRHKQFDHQLAALALLRNEFHVNGYLTIAGVLSESTVFARLKDQVRRRQLDDCVDLRTDCTDADIAALHRDADYFLFTSRSESYGVALLEAIGWGTAPVAYPHPVYRELIESSGFGLVARQASPRALAEAVVHAMNTPDAHSEDHRLRWLAERPWRRVVVPLAEALRRPTRLSAVAD